MTNHCPICASKKSKTLSEKLRRGSGCVKLCQDCGHGFLIEETQKDWSLYYASEYRESYSHNPEATATNAKEIFDIYKLYQGERLEKVRRRLKSEHSVLEIGSSSGQFLHNIVGECSLIHAIELDTECAEFSRKLGIDTSCQILEKSEFSANQYDIICSFQVLEHIEQPFDFLKGVLQRLKANGTLFLEFPNLNDPLRSIWQNAGYEGFFYHSAHLHYFTETSLLRLFDKLGLKQNDYRIGYSQDYNFLNHINWHLTEKPQSDCHLGLSKVGDLICSNDPISQWLSKELNAIDIKYKQKLEKQGKTSNFWVEIYG